jgi:hypothetical protein
MRLSEDLWLYQAPPLGNCACLLLSLEFPTYLPPVSEDYGKTMDAVKAVGDKFVA